MSERQNETASKLQIIFCGSEDDRDALMEAGFRSIRIINDVETIYDGNGDLDQKLTYFGHFVLALPRAADGLRDGLAMRLDDTRCGFVDWGKGPDTPASYAREHGHDALREIVKNSRRMWVDEVCTIDDVPESGPQKTYCTGLTKLDDHGFRLIRPAFMPVIGPYASGKSVLLRQLACNLWKMHGWRTLLTSFEEKIKPRYQRDLRRHFIGKHIDYWTRSDVEKADEEIRKAFRFLRRKRGSMMDAERLMDRIEYAVRVYGVDVVIIDPVNEIDHQVGRNEAKTEYMGRFMMGLKQLADDWNLLMIVAAHPPKDGVEKRNQKGRLLTLNDGADTAHYGNKADLGWCVWRPAMDGPTFLNYDKTKDAEITGEPTLCKLVLDKGYGKFAVTEVGYHLGEQL